MPTPQARRQFLQTLATIVSTAAIASGEPARAASSAPVVRWPNLTGSPVLDSLHPVIERSRDVCRFHGKPLELTPKVLDLAWTGYFGEQSLGAKPESAA